MTDIIVTDKYVGMTVKSVLFGELGYSHALVAKLKRMTDGIIVNGERVTVRYALRMGDILRLNDGDREEDVNPHIMPLYVPLDILYEDADCMAVNKPSGMPTIPTHGHRDDTLANVYAAHMGGAPFVFRPVNRLDRETSGIVLLAKTKAAAARLGADMEAGKIRKTYTAVLDGVPTENEGEISGYIVRRGDSIITRELRTEGKESDFSLTRWKKIATDGKRTVVEAAPVTGRTHQLRVHFASIGAPIAGDGLYGTENADIPHLLLHACKLTFPCADRSPVTVELAPPEYMEKIVDQIGNAK